MPPKNAKKQAVSRPDNSGIPKQDVEFKFNFSVKSDATQLPYAIMFEWFAATSQKTQRTDSTVIQSWSKKQQLFTFEKQFDPIRVDDDFCKTLCSKRFYLYFVNGEDNKVQDTLLLDFSSLLMFKGEQVQPTFSFQSTTIKVMGIDQFTITLTANKQLIQQLYRHFLNPLQVQVIGAKDVPIDNTSKYQPAYMKYSFFDGNQVETHPVVGRDKLIWNHKHVFLAGLVDPIELKEKIRSSYMKFELHDRDELQNKKLKEDTPLFDLTKAIEQEMQRQKPVQEDPKKKGAKKQEKKEVKKDAKKDNKKKDVKLGQPILPQKNDYFKNNYGIGAFYLVDFLKPSMRNAKYKAPIVPKNTFQDFQSRNIDLNTTARNEMQKIIASNNYFEQDTQLAVGFTLSYAIGTFVKPQKPVEPVEQPKKGKKQVVEEKPVEVKEEGGKPNDVFERVVYIIPYKDAQTLQKIENVFYQVNMKAFNLKNKRQIATYLLKKQQKQNITLDYMTGIQLLDNDGRIYVIEGLKDGAMKQINEKIVKASVNTKNFKILKNSNISFTKRLYHDFNIQLKRIRFRPSLTQILLDPSIYIKSKVSQEICNNLNLISDLKKLCDDLKTVQSMNLWPSAEVLVQIQRKFSDSLSHFDIYGVQQEVKRRKADQKNQTKFQKTLTLMQNPDLQHVTAEDFSLPKINKAIISEFVQTTPNGNTFTKKNVATKTFNKDDMKMIKTYDMKLKKAQISENEPVYIYGGQKNNWYEKQKKELRDKVANEKGKYIFTYSNEHLGLSIDPKTLQEENKREKLLAQSLNFSKQKFSSLIIKTKDQRMKLAKKPGDQDIQDLKNNPYHEQKEREKELKKNPRDMPLHSDKAQFQKYIKKPECFSQPQVIEGEKISPVQRFKMEQEQKKRLYEESKNKMMGQPHMKIKKGYISSQVIGPDKYKDILEGSPNKKGFIDVHKKSKQRRPVKEYEVSYELNEKRINPSFNPLVRIDDPSLNVGNKEFNNYQRQEVISLSTITKPLKRGDL